MSTARLEIRNQNNEVVFDNSTFPCFAIGTATFPRKQLPTGSAIDYEVEVKLFDTYDIKDLPPCVASCVDDDVWYVRNPFFLLVKTSSDGNGIPVPSPTTDAINTRDLKTGLIVRNGKLYMNAWLKFSAMGSDSVEFSAEAVYLVGVCSV